MNLTCKVIEDMLPIYYDGICSNETAALVEEHLKDCPHCRQILSNLRAEITVPEKNVDDIKPLKKIQKRFRKMRLGWMISVLCIVVLIAISCLLGIWRFWPQSFSDLTALDETSITGFSASAMIDRIGVPFMDQYRIDNTQQNKIPSEVIEILETSDYRQDFRNLLPWGVDSVGSDKHYDGRTVIVSFYNEDEYVHIQFLGSSIMTVSEEDKAGFRIYHPTNRETVDRLVEYIQTHGVTQD